ncbi:MAG: pyruvate:ferredoxin (flavodoxin) oxidoreductase [bacterium]
MSTKNVTLDGNEAAAYVAYKTNEVISIYPITPASPMGEHADSWSVQGKKNIWGTVPDVVEMQAEGGAAGAVHGSLQAGALTTTFTASQGLLLMIPNMYKIAGELTPAVFHIAARSVAAQALSIFADHSDVMAARGTGWGILFSNSVQEVMDMALISQAVSLKSRVPFLHAFDGFRTSHEIKKIERLSDGTIEALIDEEAVQAHRERGMTPDNPVLRGTAQNPDVFFQARESVNPYYQKLPQIVKKTMDQFAQLTGRTYEPYQYTGSPEADRVILVMGSGAEAAHETVEKLNSSGEKVGLLKVRMYRPFAGEMLIDALPPGVKTLTVLDRVKEPGSGGEPLYLDVCAAVSEEAAKKDFPLENKPKVTGGRFGLSSKEFTPSMVKGIFDEMKKETPKNHFTIGIKDDLSETSLSYDPEFSTESDKTTRAVFWGLGSDGTVSANKNSIKIIGQETDNYAQGYFVYDSKKSGARTISHLRFGPDPIRSTYQIKKANFVAVHQFGFLEKYNQFNCLSAASEGTTFLLNSPYGPEEVWEELPGEVRDIIRKKNLDFYVLDAYSVADEVGLGNRINTIMQTAFFAISDILPTEEAIGKIKEAIKKSYGKRGETVVKKNFKAVDLALDNLHQVTIPGESASEERDELPPVVPGEAPEFVRKVTAEMIAGRGDQLPVSLLPADGTYPTGTTKWEKRNIAQQIPIWDPDVCIQCGKCSMICPHATIRAKAYDSELLEGAPENFRSTDITGKDFDAGTQFTIQVAPEDCTGCELCVNICPAKDKEQAGRKALNMADQLTHRQAERENWEFFQELPSLERSRDINLNIPKNVQLLEPLFEFSGACAGCGETPYLSLLSELFGDRTLIANATGCTSIYGGNLPTTPWTTNSSGRGPAWNNSLFEDNGEFGLGMRLALDKQIGYARELLENYKEELGADLVEEILAAEQKTDSQIEAQRERIGKLKKRIADIEGRKARDLFRLMDKLVKKDVRIVGGDGWAYDIGYGGLDHVLASGRNINVLVLDSEVYSNTGGQSSKATPQGATAKFAMGGKPTPKKDLGMRAMLYGDVYVAQIAIGAKDTQAIKALREAEAYDGPSIVIAYSTCIAHGIDMSRGHEQMEKAVNSGHWPLYRYDPALKEEGKNPLQLDSREPKIPLKDYMYQENRFRMLKQSDPDRAQVLLEAAQKNVKERWRLYQQLASIDYGESEEK